MLISRNQGEVAPCSSGRRPLAATMKQLLRLIDSQTKPGSRILCSKQTSARISHRSDHYFPTRSNNLPRLRNPLKSNLILLCLLVLSVPFNLEAMPTNTNRTTITNTKTTTTTTLKTNTITRAPGNDALPLPKLNDLGSNLHVDDRQPIGRGWAGRFVEQSAPQGNHQSQVNKSQIDLGMVPVEFPQSTNQDSPAGSGTLLVKQLTNLIMNNQLETGLSTGIPTRMINNPDDVMASERIQLELVEAELAEGQREAEAEELPLGRRRLIRRTTKTSRGSSSEMIEDEDTSKSSPEAASMNQQGPDNYDVPPADVAELMMRARAIQDTPFPVGVSNSFGGTEATFSQTSYPTSGSSSMSDEYVTCPPDYDDPAIIIAETSGGSNLTMEQQQQLYADSSGLFNSNNSATSNNETFRGLPPGTQCYQPGFKMIEMITKVITPILFSIIIVVGLVGNIIVMLVILEDRKTERELTPTGLLILDLSLADLSFIIFCIPFTGWDYAVGHWVFGPLWCKFNQYLIVVCALSSIYTLVLMSVDRFIAIVYPIECISLRTSKNTLNAIYIKWIVILIMASPTIPRHGLIDSPLGPDQYTCRFLADQYDPLYFQIAFFVSSYLFPLILIFVLYLSLLNKLWFGSKPHGHKESIKTLESKKKVTWLVAGIVVVFALCWCPIQVMLILMRLKSHKITATYVAIQVFSHTLGYMNSCVNPIVYAFASESFLNSFKRSSLGRFCYRCLCLHNNATIHGHDYSDRSMMTTSARHHTNSLQLNTNHTLNNSTSQHRGSQQHTASHQMSLNSKNSIPTNVDRNGSMINDTNLSTTTICTTALNNNKPGFNKVVSKPLEPRDRVSPTLLPSPGYPNLQTIPQAPDELQDKSSSQTNNNNVINGHEPSSSASSSPSSSLSNNAKQAKQQLVARVIQSSNQVSHRCEPTYQRELLAP